MWFTQNFRCLSEDLGIDGRIDLKEVRSGFVDWIHLAEGGILFPELSSQ